MDAKDTPRATSTYAATIDAPIDAAYEALVRIDPPASLAARLSALGVDDRAVWSESSAIGENELGFSLCWRFRPGQTALLRWQIAVDRDGAGRTTLAVTLRASAADDEAGRRIASAWPIVETIALEHAKSLRRAVDAAAEDLPAVREPLRLPVASAA